MRVHSLNGQLCDFIRCFGIRFQRTFLNVVKATQSCSKAFLNLRTPTTDQDCFRNRSEDNPMTFSFSVLRTSLAGAALLGLLVTSPATWAQDHSGHSSMTMKPSMMMKAAAAGGPQFKVGDLVVTAPWSRATPKGAKIGAGYLTIRNNGTAPDRLVSVEADAAGKTDIHEMTMKDGVMHMRPLAGGITIAPGKSVVLSPSGFHLMLMDLKAPLEQGQSFEATLHFEKAGPLKVKFQIGGIGAASAPKS